MIQSRNPVLVSLSILVILVAFTCIAFADQPVPAVPETQGLVTSTGADVVGMAMETDSGAWVLTNDTTNGIHTGILNPAQVQYTTAYDANILDQAGHTVLVKSMDLNTGNKVAATQSNVNANTLLTFVATGDGGNAVGSEDLLIDGAGNSTTASDRMLCPFVGGSNMVIPAYCNIVQAGSSFDLTVGSVKTAANDRFVGTDATVPVALNYNINVQPYGTTSGSIPAMGSASAYMKAHVQEAAGQTAYSSYSPAANFPTMTYAAPVKSEDLQYSETSSASGVISTFSKSMSYISQATSTPLTVIQVQTPD